MSKSSGSGGLSGLFGDRPPAGTTGETSSKSSSGTPAIGGGVGGLFGSSSGSGLGIKAGGLFGASPDSTSSTFAARETKTQEPEGPAAETPEVGHASTMLGAQAGGPAMPRITVSDTEVERKLRNIFDRCDSNNNGLINKRELIKALRADPDVAEFLELSRQVRQEDGPRDAMEDLFQALDRDHDREVTWDEFRAHFVRRGSTSSKADAEAATDGMLKLTVEEHAMVKELFGLWEERLQGEMRGLEALAKQALEADAALTTNAVKIQALRDRQAELKAGQETADTSLSLVWEQQTSLSRLLDGLEGTLQLRVPASGIDEQADVLKAKSRADSLKVQLDELEDQLHMLTKETTDFNALKYAGPLSSVGHILDAHSSELDSIQARIDAAERKLSALGLRR